MTIQLEALVPLNGIFSVVYLNTADKSSMCYRRHFTSDLLAFSRKGPSERA
jgi:hypothetical protein